MTRQTIELKILDPRRGRGISLRFEANDPAALIDIQDRFRRRLLAVRADLVLPF